ncbi:MAG: signal peptidase I [Prevotella sp.]|nr:signal peptidase I [Prevotella sp.]
MKAALKTILAFAVAALLMLAFRSLAFTVYTVGGYGLAPELTKGDRVLVNRWSYGLRTGAGGGLFGYGRLCRRIPVRGDLVAFDSPSDSIPGVLVCRCAALPGDTVRTEGGVMVVPGKVICADEDCYWMEAVGEGNATDSRVLGPVPERYIIGRVCMVVYSHDDAMPVYEGYSADRLFMMK